MLLYVGFEDGVAEFGAVGDIKGNILPKANRSKIIQVIKINLADI